MGQCHDEVELPARSVRLWWSRADGLLVRIVFTHRRCVAYKAASTASPEPIGFTEGAPMPLQSQPSAPLTPAPPLARTHAWLVDRKSVV